MQTLLTALAAPLIGAHIVEQAPLMMAETVDNSAESHEREKFLAQQSLIISVGTYPCVFKIGDDFYDYTPMKLGAKDQGLVPEAVYMQNTDLHYYWNWCEHLSEIENSPCKGNYYAAGKLTDDTACTAYSGGNPTTDIQDELINGKISYANGTISENAYDGVKLTYSNGAPCPNSSGASSETTYSFSLNMYCDPEMEFDFEPVAMGDVCSPYVSFRSKYACPVLSVSELWGYIEQYEAYFGAFAIVTGFLLCFMGHFLVKPSICFAGFLSSTAVSCFIFYAVYLNDTGNLDDFWYFLAGGMVAGIVIGLVLAYVVKVGAALLAGWGGVCLALVLNEAIFYRAGQPWLYWVSIVAIAIGCAVAAFFIFDHAVILATVFVGAYAMMRGVSAYAGHYYNEATMAKMLQDGLLDEIDPYYWAYIGGFALAVLIGCCVQFNRLKRIKAETEAKRHPYQAQKGKKDRK